MRSQNYLRFQLPINRRFDLALGSNLQAIVTRDEAAAQRAISLLKQQRAGRGDFPAGCRYAAKRAAQCGSTVG